MKNHPESGYVRVKLDELEQLANGLENCIGNARLRKDGYDAGYMTAMLHMVQAMLSASGEKG